MMSVMASTTSDNDKKLKKLDKKSKKIFKKNKLKGSQNHINPKATENDPIKERHKKGYFPVVLGSYLRPNSLLLDL